MAAMEVAGIQAARWVVGKALGPASGGVLEAWAASSELGSNIRALRMELLYAQAMLNNTRGRGRGSEIQNPALAEMLQELRDLAYRADDVMDELDYFRIQDELDGTYHAADEHEAGCLRNQAIHARHTARAIKKMLGFSKCSRSGSNNGPDEDTRGGGSCGAWPCLGLTTPPDHDEQEEDESQGDQEVDDGCMGRLASGARDTIHTVGKHLPCYSNIASSGRRFLCFDRPNKAPQREQVMQAPKLKFDRVEMSQTMKEIVEQLKPVCAKVSTILNLELLDSNRSIAQCIATILDPRRQGHTPLPKNMMSRPITTSQFIEPKCHGREDERSKIIDTITKGKVRDEYLTVLPIVGPGGIGKTTLVQYVYNDEELQKHFEIKLWICVSVNFNVYRLTQEIADKLTKDKGDSPDSPDKLVEERLKSKRFLLVLDDVWDCSDEDEWKRFLAPFTRGQTKGCAILVTTRFPALAQMVKTTENWIDLKGLDPKSFRDLFLACVFGDKQSESDHSGLLEIGDMIVEKLKGSPLAAKTVGRLLRNHLDLDHWTRVLESKEWESQKGDHDIMPALKLSFDYLPFHLQQCFTYCALFPEDYKFGSEELVHLWIGLDVVPSYGENRRIEDIGQRYLKELVDHGFFKKEDDGRLTYYVIHDLLHELALKVSADECLSLYSSNVRSTQIPPSIRHLSINIDDSSLMDRKSFDICKEDFSALGGRLKFENLHSLMLFGIHQCSFVKTFRGLFSKAKALRVVFLSEANYSVEDLLHSFSRLIHLRYFRIIGPQPPKDTSRFYHLRVLDLKGCYEGIDLPIYTPRYTRDMRNLVKLRHFLVLHDETHSNIFEVGKLKSLQELRRFEVKRESQGFELRQIGHLLEVCGSLHISHLERVEVKEEVDEAKLMHKSYLHKLLLDWDINRSNKDPAHEEQVLECLKPASNLLELCIRGHGGTTCPSWLGAKLSVRNLESLCLESVAWKRFPPIGGLWPRNEEFSSNTSDQYFWKLRRMELVKLAELKKWVVDSTYQWFCHLEVLIIEGCPELEELSFSHSTSSQQEQKTWFPKLQELKIIDCPKLLLLPPVPWTRSRCSISIKNVGLGFKKLVYAEDYESLLSLEIECKDAPDTFWMALDFHNLIELKKLTMEGCPPLSLDHLQMLSSLKTLKITYSNNAFGPVKDGSHAQYQFPVERFRINWLTASGKELTQVLACMPKLSKLEILNCENIAGLGVAEQEKNATSSSNGVEAQVERQKNSRTEEEIVADEGLLLLPPQLQKVTIYGCPKLCLIPYPAGLQGLCSLQSLVVENCPRFLSSYLSSSPACLPLPASLRTLKLRGAEGMETLAPLSNLTSLTELMIHRCGSLRGGEDLWRLLAHGCLTKLRVYETPKFFHGSEPSEQHEQQRPSPCSSRLQSLETDDAAGVLVATICTLLSSSLNELTLDENEEMDRFTKEQEEALPLLTSLQELTLSCNKKLQCLPAGLQRLPCLKRLEVNDCQAICSLPKDGLPNSLQELEISSCPALRRLPKDGLPNSLQELRIVCCTALQTLPRDGFPSSLQILDVECGNSEELRRQCCKLIGTIPIVRA